MTGIYFLVISKNRQDISNLISIDNFNITNNVSNISSSPASTQWEIVEVAQGLFVPWSIVFTSENRALVSERNGKIRMLLNNKIQADALYSFSDVISDSGNEEGLMGLAIDPNYTENKFVYACYASRSTRKILNRIVRFTDTNEKLNLDKVILDNIPSAELHAGCELGFGPDGKLYITTGDAGNKENAQDLASLAGKILRINSDGTTPEDNPFPNSPVYTLGHRNSQGISWAANGTMISSEHGPSGFDGPRGGDEINIIKKGANYGWPRVSHDKTDPQFETPKKVFTPAIAPSSILVYSGKMFPEFKNRVFVSGLVGTGLYSITFEDETFVKILDAAKIQQVDFGRIREVTESPSGEIYISTSNRDGRGSPKANDDRIYKIKKR
ncbi:MAG: PQQ-dependent sugar dehydrogenase [Niabella sp.]|nr:MAG: PQQ-dependent sugar dehydrogenase [Niabella sp.]